eukprot:356565-Chlamydomonas_euryale.AAC.2
MVGAGAKFCGTGAVCGAQCGAWLAVSVACSVARSVARHGVGAGFGAAWCGFVVAMTCDIRNHFSTVTTEMVRGT